MICKKCGKEIMDGSSLCQACGEEARPKPKYCSKCGAEAGLDAVVCIKCGAPLPAAGSDFLTTLLLAIFLGYFGIHRFYTGQVGFRYRNNSSFNLHLRDRRFYLAGRRYNMYCHRIL